MLVDREARPDAATLRHIADAQAIDDVRLKTRRLAPANTDAAGPRRFQAGNGVAQGTLSHAVSAYDGEHAVVDPHRYALNGVALAVIDLKVLDLQRRWIAAFSHDDLRGTLAAPADHLRFLPACPL